MASMQFLPFLFAFFSVCGAQACPIGFQRMENSCIKFVETSLSFFNAEVGCNGLSPLDGNCHLVSLDRFELHDQIISAILRNPGYTQLDWWIGGENVFRDRGDWNWYGLDLPFQQGDIPIRWSVGFPRGDGYCAHIWSADSFKMRDDNCYSSKSFICEIRDDPDRR